MYVPMNALNKLKIALPIDVVSDPQIQESRLQVKFIAAHIDNIERAVDERARGVAAEQRSVQRRARRAARRC